MTEQAPKDTAFSPVLPNFTLMRARQSPSVLPGEKVVSLGLPVAAEPPQSASEPRPQAARDWASALELVQEASEAIRVGEERANQLEEQLAQVLNEAGEEIKRLTAQIETTEQRLAEAEQRASSSETRATEAEAWLVKFHDAVVAAFTPVMNGASGDREDDKTAAVPTA